MDKNEQKTSLTEKLFGVQNALDAGLKKGLNFADLFRSLTTTTDYAELLHSANQLFEFNVDSDSVVFPKKFDASDYYLIFMTRLIELSGLKTKLNLEIGAEDNHQILLHSWKATDQKFRFEAQAGRVNYVDQGTRQTVFSIDLKAQKMSFETDTINATYFLNNASDQDQEMLDEIELFTKFGKILEEVYDFVVDFNMFDARNEKAYEFNQLGLSTKITDELFIDAAQNHFTLLNGENYLGAFLQLNNSVVFSIFQEDAESDQWALSVQDSADRYSLFDVLKKYDFLNDWYVRNISDLKLKMLF